MARSWEVEPKVVVVVGKTSEATPSEQRIVYTPIGRTPPSGNGERQWPHKNRTNVILTGIIIAVCVIVGLYFILRGKDDGKDKRDPDALFPPDPEVDLPASPSILRVFKRAAVCTDGVACSIIGRDILKKNGSAVDAAIASMFCNGIVNIHSMGIGGGFLMTVYKRDTNEAFTLKARETAPSAATAELFRNNSNALNTGPLSIAVPGELKGYWEAHKKFGVLPWKDLVEPSLKLCDTGYNMSKAQYDSIYNNSVILENPSLREMFYDENLKQPKRANSVIKPMKSLCNTLKIIAEEGGDTLYNGSLSRELFADLQDIGSIITKEDLGNYKAQWESPVALKLQNNDNLYSIAPPGSGALLGYVLNILTGYGFTKDSIADINSTILTYHRIVEAFKYTYAKRTLLGDTQFINITNLLKNLTSPELGEATRKLINDKETSNDPKHYGAETYNQPDDGTAHISILAPNGDAVSATSTINFYYGSHLTGKRTGITLNNCMSDFSSLGHETFGIPASPNNLIEPGKRAMSSMTPTIITDNNGDVKLVIGASGATKITTAIAMVIMRTLWFEQNAKEAVDAARIHHQVFPMEISYEYGITRPVVDGLKALGHKMERYSDRGSIVCAIFKNATGIYGNADYRKGGDVFGLD